MLTGAALMTASLHSRLRKGWLDPELDAGRRVAATGGDSSADRDHRAQKNTRLAADCIASSNAMLLEAVAAARAEPTGVPWGLPTPALCKKTAAVVLQATQGWAPSRHWLHHPAFRDVVVAVLLVGQRLDNGLHARAQPATVQRCACLQGGSSGTTTAAPSPSVLGAAVPRRSSGDVCGGDCEDNSGGGEWSGNGVDNSGGAAVWLPSEMWVLAMGFCLRSWWPAPS